MEKKEVWICSNCGKKYGNKPVGIATWHEDVCDICGKKTMVTEPRDFGGLKQSREIPVEHISKKMYPMGSNVNEELFDWACSELEILEDKKKKQVLRDVISQSYKEYTEEEIKKVKSKERTNKGYKLLNTIEKNLMENLWKIQKRCLLEGCRYGIEGVDEKPLDKCIYCGMEKPAKQFEGLTVPDMIKMLKEVEDEK